MSETSPIYEEAKKCPRCHLPGEFKSKNPAKRENGEPCTIELYACANDRCEDLGQFWIIQINRDGTIPVRQPGEKQFAHSPQRDAIGRHYIEQIKEEEERAARDAQS